MKVDIVTKQGKKIAMVNSNEPIITEVSTLLDFFVTMQYDYDTNLIAINKNLISKEFFVLSTKFAGEVIQKCVNYGFKLAIYGDFSEYTSKPLKDFMYESNQGRDIFFVATEEEAIHKLAAVR